MRTEKGFRYTLQFPAENEVQLQVGGFLEHLGSKKSRFIVQVLAEYLEAHPELLEPGSKVQLSAAPISKDALRQLIQEVIAERGLLPQASESVPKIVNSCEDSLSSMLENLTIFG